MVLMDDYGKEHRFALGQVVDEENDEICIDFDNKGNHFISLDESDTENLEISVDMLRAEIGNFTVEVRHADSNETDCDSIKSFAPYEFDIEIILNNTQPRFV